MATAMLSPAQDMLAAAIVLVFWLLLPCMFKVHTAGDALLLPAIAAARSPKSTVQRTSFNMVAFKRSSEFESSTGIRRRLRMRPTLQPAVRVDHMTVVLAQPP
jgi:hypothetical protein